MTLRVIAVDTLEEAVTRILAKDPSELCGARRGDIGLPFAGRPLGVIDPPHRASFDPGRTGNELPWIGTSAGARYSAALIVATGVRPVVRISPRFNARSVISRTLRGLLARLSTSSTATRNVIRPGYRRRHASERSPWTKVVRRGC